MRVLFVLVAPTHQHLFDADFVWEQVGQTLGGLGEEIDFKRLDNPTSSSFSKAVKANNWDVLHLITQTQEREGAYSTIALLSADGHLRYIPATHLAEEIAAILTLKMVVLQVVAAEARASVRVPQTLIEAGVETVVCSALFNSPVERKFIDRLYRGILSDLSVDLQASRLADVGHSSPIQIFRKTLDYPLLVTAHDTEQAREVSHRGESQLSQKDRGELSPATPISSHHDPQSEGRPAVEQQTVSQLDKRRSQKDFDVFLCHNSEDKHFVTDLAVHLERSGILPWLDAWEVGAGYFQEQLEEGLAHCKLAVVCMGRTPIDRWQKAEMHMIVDAHATGKITAIPIWLPSVPIGKEPRISSLLAQLHWVDFRSDEPPPLSCLVRLINKAIRERQTDAEGANRMH